MLPREAAALPSNAATTTTVLARMFVSLSFEWTEHEAMVGGARLSWAGRLWLLARDSQALTNDLNSDRGVSPIGSLRSQLRVTGQPHSSRLA